MSSKQLKILLVDDDKNSFTIINDLISDMKGQNFILEWAPTFDAGLANICKKNHDIYFVDYRLGEGAGIELVRTGIENGCDAPFIMLTAKSNHEVDAKAIRSGASDYLIKDEMNSSILERSIRHAIEQKQAVHALMQAKEYAENIIRSSLDMIIAMDLKFNIIEFNQAAQNVFGYKKEEVINLPFEILCQSRSKSEHIINKTLKEKVYSGEAINIKKDNTVFPVYISASILSDTKGAAIGIVAIVRDISQEKELQEKLMHDAMHDSLTNLPNKNLFISRVKFALERKKRRKSYNFAVLFIDIDRFKLVNESLGHRLGDSLLISIAKRLNDCIRSCDTIARFGGDEFAVLLEDVEDTEVVKIIADRLLQSMEMPFSLNNQYIFSSASIGIALSSNEYENTEDILRDADTGMYRAKSMGKARYAIFDVEMHSKVVELLKLEADLRRAVERREFVVYYQPIINLKNGTISGVEALVRWQHPERGLIAPFYFIPLAEETGLIVALGEQVIEQACKQYVLWKKAGFPQIKVIVNFSSIQFQSPKLLTYFKETIKKTGMDPHHFGVEITESTIMEQTEFSITVLKEIQKMGVTIAIDDFGTGYSALSSLRLFPIHKIKIDRSLIKDVPQEEGAATITKTIINMAHSLHLSVVAEGVETHEQLTFLRDNKSDYMQGYLFSKPVPAEEITAMLKDKKCL